ncbi:sigma-70 family RNA polymerase sigma factor [Maribacter halichondriae]|uniref:sigma-70 family RNA polymerase sigma factor n=1 Tax=Maribacter halichondriae TaxID=2980554 RepID=UPI002359B3A7|nr:sigma-70 family RNA polymerase sigma factor [Maribacter sp. Hal144]
MKNTVNYFEQERKFHVFVAGTFSKLDEFKKKGDSISFNMELLKILPEVKRYVGSRLLTTLNKGIIDKNKFRTEDFIDQLFIEVYDHFDEVANAKELHPWLFKKADELLDDAIVEEEFDTLFFDNIDDYSKPEWDAMEEKFSTDGDGDLVMFEELDDSFYKKNAYTLNHVFVEDDEQELATKLDEQLDQERIENHMKMVFNRMSSTMKSVFELFTDHQFLIPEIAKIKSLTVQEVEKLLADARKMLRTSFSKRYLIDSN